MCRIAILRVIKRLLLSRVNSDPRGWRARHGSSSDAVSVLLIRHVDKASCKASSYLLANLIHRSRLYRHRSNNSLLTRPLTQCNFYAAQLLRHEIFTLRPVRRYYSSSWYSRLNPLDAKLYNTTPSVSLKIWKPVMDSFISRPLHVPACVFNIDTKIIIPKFTILL